MLNINIEKKYRSDLSLKIITDSINTYNLELNQRTKGFKKISNDK